MSTLRKSKAVIGAFTLPLLLITAALAACADDAPQQSQPAQQSQQTQPQPQQSAADTTAQQQETQEQPQQQPEQPQPEQPESQQSQQQAQQAQQEDPQPEPQPEPEPDPLQLRADEIRADATVTDLVGIIDWLNGDETSIALELAKDNIVLIDFWTYTCINCVRTLPFLTAWDRKYRDHGLVIIGVHTPEFEFEERIENVRAAIAEHDIEYLVAIDNDYNTWRAFQNRWWPRKFLIGPSLDGDSPMAVRYDHIGEGDYPETELAIREALEAIGKDLSDVPLVDDVSISNRIRPSGQSQTRELYAGWRRNVGSGGPYAGQDAYFLAGEGVPTTYSDVDTEDRRHNLWYLEGIWRTEEEYIVHARQTSDLEDHIALLVRGRTANVVLTLAEDGRPYDVFVELDGQWLTRDEAGEHVQWDSDGRSFIRVDENDLYRLLFLPEWANDRELKLSSNSDQFRIFAFTFGSYVGGE